MADEVKLAAIATEASINVPGIPRDLVHLGLHQRGVVVILAVRAAATASLGLIDLHRLAKRTLVFGISTALVAGLFRAKHPVIDDGLRVLLVLGSGDERLTLAQTSEAFNHDHGLFHATISRPDARIVKEAAALAMVEMNEPESSTWPTSSGKV